MKAMKLSTNYLIISILTISMSIMLMFTDVFKNKWILNTIWCACLLIFGLIFVISIYTNYRYKNNSEHILQFKNEIIGFYINFSRLLITLVCVIYLINMYIAYHLNELSEMKLPVYTYCTYMLTILLTYVPKIMDLEENNESNMLYIDFLKTTNDENVVRNDSLKSTINSCKKKIDEMRAENLELTNKFNTMNSLINSRNHRRINKINRKNKIINTRKLRQ